MIKSSCDRLLALLLLILACLFQTPQESFCQTIGQPFGQTIEQRPVAVADEKATAEAKLREVSAVLTLGFRWPKVFGQVIRLGLIFLN